MDHGSSEIEPSGASGGKLPSDGGRAHPLFFTKLFHLVLLSRRTMMAKRGLSSVRAGSLAQ